MKTVYLALGLLLLPGMLWAQGSEKENEFTMSMQIRPRAEYRNGAQLPRFEGDKAASFINNRARLSMEYKRSDLSMKISAQHVGVWGQDPHASSLHLNPPYLLLSAARSDGHLNRRPFCRCKICGCVQMPAAGSTVWLCCRCFPSVLSAMIFMTSF